jgi:hypothetical protein
MKFGTVYNRSLELLEKPHDLQIDVLFRPEDIEFEWPDGYVMVIYSKAGFFFLSIIKLFICYLG